MRVRMSVVLAVRPSTTRTANRRASIRPVVGQDTALAGRAAVVGIGRMDKVMRVEGMAIIVRTLSCRP